MYQFRIANDQVRYRVEERRETAADMTVSPCFTFQCTLEFHESSPPLPFRSRGLNLDSGEDTKGYASTFIWHTAMECNYLLVDLFPDRYNLGRECSIDMAL